MTTFIIIFAACLVWLFSIVFIVASEEFDHLNRITRVAIIVLAPLVVIVMLVVMFGYKSGEWYAKITTVVITTCLIFSLSACSESGKRTSDKVILTSIDDGRVITITRPSINIVPGDSVVVGSSSINNVNTFYGRYVGKLPQSTKRKIEFTEYTISYGVYVVDTFTQ